MRSTEANELMRGALDFAGEKYVQSLQTSLQMKDGIASGRLNKSLTYVVTKEGQGFNLDILGIGYWRYKNYGRGPSRDASTNPRPPAVLVRAIKQWVLEKGITPSLYYIIARKIHLEGTSTVNLGFATEVFTSELNGEIMGTIARAGLDIIKQNMAAKTVTI